MRLLDLFSGIGGFSLAAEWVWRDELEIVGFCEIEKYAQKVLQKNFPGVPIYEDIKKLNGKDFKNIDLITGGFPCQDISIAGRGAGIKEGTRSGLWFEMWRIISEIRPRYALIENVPMLTIRGGTRVVADLAEIGYDAEWQIIGADDVGAWHRRKRIWIVAYPGNLRSQKTKQKRKNKIKSRRQVEIRNGITGLRHNVPDTDSDGQLCRQTQIDIRQTNNISPIYKKTDVPDTDGIRSGKIKTYPGTCETGQSPNDTGQICEDVSNSDSDRFKNTLERQTEIRQSNSRNQSSKGCKSIPNTTSIRQSGSGEPIEPISKKKDKNRKTSQSKSIGFRDFWSTEPNVGRVAHGIPSRVDRLKGLGNAIVPQVVALIMERIKNETKTGR